MHEVSEWKIDEKVAQAYLKTCRDAFFDDRVFDTFKSLDSYTAILEHTGKKIGDAYLEKIWVNHKELLFDYPKIWENDLYGNATHKAFIHPDNDDRYFYTSPSTIQYIGVLSNLMERFKTLEYFKIVEIGGGYGGQCKIIQDVFKVRSYDIIDLPEVGLLQRKYLKKLNCLTFDLFTPDDYVEDNYDLVISNYALTEIAEPMQSNYMDNIVMNCKHGYLTCNGPLSRINELRNKFKVEIIKDIDGEKEDNFIVIW